jgi:hypothetical protein
MIALVGLESSQLRSLLPERMVRHARQDSNGAAHNLAQRAIRELECVVKRHGAPECVRDMIRREATGTHDTSHDCNAQKK